jgi:hypothetical protein
VLEERHVLEVGEIYGVEILCGALSWPLILFPSWILGGQVVFLNCHDVTLSNIDRGPL